MKPIVYKIDDDLNSLQTLQEKLENKILEKEVLFDYPTVYIHDWKKGEGYEVYVGESNNVIQRTKQHFDQSGDKSKWQYQLKKKTSSLYIIGYDHFNKSLTLDQNLLKECTIRGQILRTDIIPIVKQMLSSEKSGTI